MSAIKNLGRINGTFHDAGFVLVGQMPAGTLSTLTLTSSFITANSKFLVTAQQDPGVSVSYVITALVPGVSGGMDSVAGSVTIKCYAATTTVAHNIAVNVKEVNVGAT